MSNQAAPGFSLFVSSVEGALVTRYGSRTLIGATRTPTSIEWDTELITAIPTDEYERFRREYDRALRDGSLVERSAEDWLAQHQLHEEQDRANVAKRDAAKAAKE